VNGGNGKDQPTPGLVPAEEALDPTAAEATSSNEEPKGVALHQSETEAATAVDLDEVETLKRERDQLRDQLLRRRADFENFKRRVERDRRQAAQDALAGVFKALVPTLDNLERALGASGDEASVRDGVDLIRRDLLALLEGQGVATEDPLGQKFDPTRHQALSCEPTPGFAEGAVVEVYRKGYSFRDRLLRPALVKVASADGSGEESGEGQVP
jgi:molecular chaperone GrpE